jgi:hypothetical protein
MQTHDIDACFRSRQFSINGERCGPRLKNKSYAIRVNFNQRNIEKHIL